MFRLIQGNTPLILQAETHECALACLAMVLGHHRRHTTLQALRGLNPGGHPLSLEQLCQQAQAQGLQTRAIRCEPGDLQTLALPAIIHLDMNHYAVMVRANAGRVEILDPACGQVTLSGPALDRRFTGVALELTPAADFEPRGAPADNSPLSFVRSLQLTGLGSALANLLILSICVQLFSLVLPFFVQIVVDEVITSRNQDLLAVVTVAFALAYLLTAFMQWLRGMTALHVGAHLSYHMAAGLMQRLVNLRMAFFQRRSVGDIVSRFGSLKPLQDFLTESAIRILLDLVMAVSCFVVVFCYDATAALWMLLITLLCLLAQYAIYLPYRRHTHEAIVADARAQGHFIETIQSMDTVRRHEAETRRTAGWLNGVSQTLNAQIRAGRMQALFEMTRFLASGFILLGLVAVSARLVTGGEMTLGMLYAMIAYSNHFASAFLSLSMEWQRLMMLSLHVQRLSDITSAPAVRRIRIDPASAVRIDCRNISYRHPGQPFHLLQAMSLQVGDSEKVAVTGESGTGKTTLLRLLMAEAVPDTGEIQVNHRPLHPGLSVYPVMASLLQSDRLITGTIADNIAFMDPAPDHQRIRRAAALAEIDREILQLPLGYLERVSDAGPLLSAGQTQRLLIARVLYRQCPVLLLDECTSHLDDETATRVMANILQLPGACIFVTHSAALAAMADRTICLDRLTQPPAASLQQTGRRIT
ncbi:MAG: peptidase domain-containing ABC transporter [Proteobacteria bacterium]|nr:peptidase domain-containing ABC transporter [Pseudomonadota bacterium]